MWSLGPLHLLGAMGSISASKHGNWEEVAEIKSSYLSP